MKRLKIFGLIAALALVIPNAGMAEAEATPAPLAVADSWDADTWTFGGQQWLAPIETELEALAEGESATVRMWQSDVQIIHDVYADELEHDAQLICSYSQRDEGLILSQIKLHVEAADMDEYTALSENGRKLLDLIDAKSDDIILNYDNPDDESHIFDNMINGEEFGQAYWSSMDDMSEYGGKKMRGLVGVIYDRHNGIYALDFSFGVAAR